MAVLAVLLPLVMLGLVLALGRYEDLMLRPPSASRTPAPPGSGTAVNVPPANDVQSGCEE